MRKEDLHFLFQCPVCKRFDNLPTETFEELVMSPTKKDPEVGKYSCPYGCGVKIVCVCKGTYEETTEYIKKLSIEI